MSYVNENTTHGEDILYEAHIHWFIFIPGGLMLTIGACLFSVGIGIIAPMAFGQFAYGAEFIAIFLGLFLILSAVFSLIRAMIIKLTTELAITTKRVIAKIGLVRRSTVELNHSKVESLNVEQSITGRILDFGTVIVNGTGGGNTPIPGIDAPLDFRRKAMEIIDSSQ